MDFIKQPILKQTSNLIFLDKLSAIRTSEKNKKVTTFSAMKALANTHYFAKDLAEIDLSKLIDKIQNTQAADVQKLFSEFYLEIIPNANAEEIDLIFQIACNIKRPENFFTDFPTYCQTIGLSSLADNFSIVFNLSLTEKDKNILSIIYLTHLFSLYKNLDFKAQFAAIDTCSHFFSADDIKEPSSLHYLSLKNIQAQLHSEFQAILPYMPFSIGQYLAMWQNYTISLDEVIKQFSIEELKISLAKTFAEEKNRSFSGEYLFAFDNSVDFSSAQLLFAQNVKHFSFETLASFGEKLIFLKYTEITELGKTKFDNNYDYIFNEDEPRQRKKDFESLNDKKLNKILTKYLNKIDELTKEYETAIGEWKKEIPLQISALEHFIKDVIYCTLYPFGLCLVFSKLNHEQDKGNKTFYLAQLLDNCYCSNSSQNKEFNCSKSHLETHLSSLYLNTLLVLIEHKKDISSSINPTEKNFSHYLKSAIQADYSLNLLNLTRVLVLDKLFLSEEEISNQNFFARYPENLEDTFLRVFTTNYKVDFYTLHSIHISAIKREIGRKMITCLKMGTLFKN